MISDSVSLSSAVTQTVADGFSQNSVKL